MTAQPLAGRDVARRFDVSIRRLQSWRKIGLLAPGHRTAGGHWRYTEEDVHRVHLICTLLGAGLSIRTIRRVIEPLAEEVERMLEGACTRTAEELLAAIRAQSSREEQRYATELEQLGHSIHSCTRESPDRVRST